MAFQTFTLNGAAGAGYVQTLTVPAATFALLATAECYVKPVAANVTTSTPGASPAPAQGSSADYYHLLAGQSVTLGADQPTPPPSQGQVVQDSIAAFQVWFIAAGELRGAGH